MESEPMQKKRKDIVMDWKTTMCRMANLEVDVIAKINKIASQYQMEEKPLVYKNDKTWKIFYCNKCHLRGMYTKWMKERCLFGCTNTEATCMSGGWFTGKRTKAYVFGNPEDGGIAFVLFHFRYVHKRNGRTHIGGRFVPMLMQDDDILCYGILMKEGGLRFTDRFGEPISEDSEEHEVFKSMLLGAECARNVDDVLVVDTELQAGVREHMGSKVIDLVPEEDKDIDGFWDRKRR